MYGKIHETMYDGTIVDHWEALVTFQQMIVLADEVGVVDITPSALSRRTGIPIEIIEKGIIILESEDEFSRSVEQNGKRIERLDLHRPWGWKIVNYKKYRDLSSREEKKKADRDRISEKRGKAPKNEDVANCRKPSQSVANVAHTDTHTHTYTNKTKEEPKSTEVAALGIDLDLWREYLKTRKKLKAPNTDRALNTLINKVTKLKNEGFNPGQLIEEANERGWKSVFAPQSSQGQQNNGKPTVAQIARNLATDESWAN